LSNAGEGAARGTPYRLHWGPHFHLLSAVCPRPVQVTATLMRLVRAVASSQIRRLRLKGASDSQRLQRGRI